MRKAVLVLLVAAVSWVGVAFAQDKGAGGGASYVPVDISKLCNNDGIAPDDDATGGDFAAGGASYPAKFWPKVGKTGVTVNGVPFLLAGADKKTNNISCEENAVLVPAGNYKAILMLASATNVPEGSMEDALTLVYKDGTKSAVNFKLTDWCVEPKEGEKKAYSFTYRMSTGTEGGHHEIACYLFLQTVKIDAKKELASIKLPEQKDIHVFAITLQK